MKGNTVDDLDVYNDLIKAYSALLSPIVVIDIPISTIAGISSE